jgi:VCBS repeat-containing protein
VTYTVNSSLSAVQALDVGEVLHDSHTCTASDGTTQLITVTINGAEDGAVLGGTTTGVVAEDDSLVASGSLVISDIDTSDNPVTFNNQTITPGDNGYGHFELNSVTWTNTLETTKPSVQSLASDALLSDSHTFAASAGSTQLVTVKRCRGRSRRDDGASNRRRRPRRTGNTDREQWIRMRMVGGCRDNGDASEEAAIQLSERARSAFEARRQCDRWQSHYRQFRRFNPGVRGGRCC